MLMYSSCITYIQIVWSKATCKMAFTIVYRVQLLTVMLRQEWCSIHHLPVQQ